MAELPYACTNFESLRNSGMIYVDKTDLIYDIARLKIPYFLTRPRRFGKSLLLSTLESIFSNGTKYFKDLKIEKLWKEQNTYKVIRLDFSSLTYDDPASFDRGIKEKLLDYVSKYKLPVVKRKDNRSAGETLSMIINSVPTDTFVLLIDEYDHPLTHSLDDKELFSSLRNYLSGFFGAIKSDVGRLRFFFMTGVGKFAKASVFSQLNNLLDISQSAKYAALLGYTEEELRFYFNDHVCNAAKLLHVTYEQIYTELKNYYDGYRMTEDSSKQVYNPWSCLSFLLHPENGFRNYWYETGGAYPTIIAKYLRSIKETPLESLLGVKITKDDLNTFYDYFEVPTVSLLYQTGYLTIREEYNELYKMNQLVLSPPNLEVKSALAKLYLMEIRKEKIGVDDIHLSEVLRADFAEHNYSNMEAHFNIILNNFGYDNKVAFADERNCRDFVDLALCVGGLYTRKEVVRAKGRADLVVELPDERFIFEFKLSKNKSDEVLLNEASLQLKEKKYGEILPIKRINRIAVVINSKKKGISFFKLLKE
ncbi:PD-(D/E)XK nuclease superfamily protein [Succinivibrio dextrinosolvens]|uniref:AAA family ATPase n=1 Tax=Succinivibrio dextrinosolvens TaxID=83771 RepID=UPI0008E31AF7|nr:AAA family ATPase [Succinivibrio dextrinosolvens]SFS87083.1 PD-(D/E)XK nuclease superfamily protein [Succinivibrio dextrinosolvens]